MGLLEEEEMRRRGFKSDAQRRAAFARMSGKTTVTPGMRRSATSQYKYKVDEAIAETPRWMTGKEIKHKNLAKRIISRADDTAQYGK